MKTLLVFAVVLGLAIRPVAFGAMADEVPEDFKFSAELPSELPDITKWDKTWGEVELCSSGGADLIGKDTGLHPIDELRLKTEPCPDDAEPEDVVLVLQYVIYFDPATPLKYSLYQFGFRGIVGSTLVWHVNLKETRVFLHLINLTWQEYKPGDKHYQPMKNAAVWVNATHGLILSESHKGTLTPVR